jgi:hypothetical protein
MNKYDNWQLLYNNKAANHATPLTIIGLSSIGVVIHWSHAHWYTGVTDTTVYSFAE